MCLGLVQSTRTTPRRRITLHLSHIGFTELGGRLSKALDICGQFEKKISITGRDTGCTGKELGDYVVATVQDSSLDSRWEAYVNA